MKIETFELAVADVRPGMVVVGDRDTDRVVHVTQVEPDDDGYAVRFDNDQVVWYSSDAAIEVAAS